MESGSAVMMTWSKAGVIAEALGSIGIVFTLFYSVWSFTTTLRDAYYAELDRVYFELLKSAWSSRSCSPFPPAQSGQGGRLRRLRVHGLELRRDHLRPLPGLVEATPARDLVPNHRRRERPAPRVVRAPENRRRFKQRFVRFIEAQYPAGRAASVRRS